MDTEALIELVRKHPVLYNYTDPRYMDWDAKKFAWDRIGEEMFSDGHACKLRWNNIRDNYRKSLKRAKIRSELGDVHSKLYKHSDRLEFLRNCFEQEKVVNGVKSETISQEESYPEKEESVDVSDESKTMEEFEPVERPPSPPPAETRENISSPRKVRQRRAVPRAPQQSTAATLMDYLIKRQNSAAQSPHPVDSFLSALAPTLKGLSPYQWHLAKAELFSTVLKFEEAMLKAK